MQPQPSRLALALAALLAAPAAWAQQTPTAPHPDDQSHHDKPVELDKVVVTASPLRSDSDAMAQPSEVLAGEALDRARSATLGETVNRLPGVQASSFGAGVARPVIRGMDGARIGVMSGGLSSGDVSAVSQDHAVAIEPFLADQIEVLKGPSTLLFGSGAIGGVVNVVDGRIAEHAGGEPFAMRTELRGSTVDHGALMMGRVDLTGGNGLVLHADGVLRRQDDYETPEGVQANSFVKGSAGALGLSKVWDDGFLGVSVARYGTRYGNPGEPGDAAAGEPAVTVDLDQTRYELRGGLTGDMGLLTGARLSIGHVDYAHAELEGSEVGTQFRSHGDEGRLELLHRALGPWTGAVGLQLGRREFQALGEEAFVPPSSSRSKGLFVVEQGRFGPLEVNFGGRLERVDMQAEGIGKRAFSPTSLSLGAIWSLAGPWQLNLALDRAERAPAEEELFADGPHAATATYEIGDPGMRVERANQLDLALHHHGALVDAKLAAFANRFDGFIYLRDTGLTEDDLPVRHWTQGDARFRGVEAEVVVHAIKRADATLDLRLFGDRVRATLADGSNVPRLAPARIGAGLEWRGQSLHASFDLLHAFAQDRLAAGETRTDGYTLLGAHLAWHTDVQGMGAEWFVDAANLGNAVARNHTSYLKHSVLMPGRNITFGVRLYY